MSVFLKHPHSFMATPLGKLYVTHLECDKVGVGECHLNASVLSVHLALTGKRGFDPLSTCAV